MSAAEMKQRLMEKVDKLTEEQLAQVSQFVDSFDTMPAKEYNLLPHAEQIIKERAEVLKKLAK